MGRMLQSRLRPYVAFLALVSAVLLAPSAPALLAHVRQAVIPRAPDAPIARMTEDELVQALRAKLEKDAAADRFTGTVLFARTDQGGGRGGDGVDTAPKVLLSGAYGLADREKNAVNTMDTRFRTDLLITGKVDIGDGRRYAYGFEDGRMNGGRSVGHVGGAPGMNGELRIYAKSGYVVAVLSNLDPPAATQVWTFIDLHLPK